MNLFCPWDGAQYLIFSANVPSILYYALVPGMLVSLSLSLYVFLKDSQSLTSRLLLFICSAFFIWGGFALILFATNKPSIVMFFWSLTILVEPMIYAGSFYLVYVFIKKKDLLFNSKLLICLTFLPFLVFLHTKYNLQGVNLIDCTAIEGPIALYYSYTIEILFSLLIIILSITEYKQASNPIIKKEIRNLTLGVLVFLITFSSGNVIGSFTDDWVTSQLGYFGMPIFIGLLAYMIVKFKTFNIKLIGAQALIVSLVVLIGSQFFFIRTNTNRILTAITLVITGTIGINLVRSVRREIEQREYIEKLAQDLFMANDRLKGLDKLKSEFVSLATHQIRGPLTAIKGYASMLLQGDFGELSPNVRKTIETIFDSSNALTVIVQDFLDISRIEQGGMKYEFTVFDFSKLVQTVGEELAPNIERKGLRLKLEVEPGILVNADAGKMRQIIGNLIDNSQKYTPKGSVTVKVAKREDMARMSVTDTGVGISPETLPKLFQKFSRAEDASKANILGTGLGLYVAKALITAQNGKIWAESDGEGKGATFFVELPLKT